MDEKGRLHGKQETIDTYSSLQEGDRRPLTVELDQKGNLKYRYCEREEIFNHGKRIYAVKYLQNGSYVEFLDGTLDHPELVDVHKGSRVSLVENLQEKLKSTSKQTTEKAKQRELYQKRQEEIDREFIEQLERIKLKWER